MQGEFYGLMIIGRFMPSGTHIHSSFLESICQRQLGAKPQMTEWAGRDEASTSEAPLLVDSLSTRLRETGTHFVNVSSSALSLNFALNIYIRFLDICYCILVELNQKLNSSKSENPSKIIFKKFWFYGQPFKTNGRISFNDDLNKTGVHAKMLVKKYIKKTAN